ncbi:ATP-dependent DNA helicase RecG [Alkalimarinus sediminis]|uniref:ATP-dependent DNA helicase RecG n=1 Tax=Alkalimarinus sediminis TaxID=1632866 RepID=A0A9E8HL44_9ALTE|nr:ATP-dependent DNA helicase RecG [Alkalimarinus sediminis]UZW75327.1 ATP-dependent DNA helicase RecG [Alkalimarinus sediminis]
MATLDDVSVTALKGVGASLASTLAKLGIVSVQDLLFHLPHRYQDRTRILPIASLRVGDQGVIDGEVTDSKVVMGRRRSLQVTLRDGSGMIVLRFFHFNAAQKQQMSVGVRLRCFGEIRRGRAGLEIYHPEYKLVSDESLTPVEDMLTPVYPLTEGIQQNRIRSLCQQALSWLDRYEIKDWLPESIRENYQFLNINDAIRFLHHPPVDANQHQLIEGAHICQQRLIFEELLAHHFSLLRLRREVQSHKAIPLPHVSDLEAGLLEPLPFTLTNAQQHVADEIKSDIQKSIPMLRLVQGDVGSGKTIVAAIAAAQAVGNHCQIALMAPTEILAEQHWINFQQWFEPLGLSMAWLSGKTKGKQRTEALDKIASGEASIVIGTHALFQPEVKFHKLAMVVIDEQHRFGVHQRLALKDKGALGGFVPHQLIMTATPIPRTLAMSAYADLDTSVIDELPPGRQPIETVVISDARRDQVISRVREACLEGRQAYWVCTLVEESEALQCQAAEVTAATLTEQLPDLKVGLVHGRMKAKDKSAVMDAFKQGQLDLLVATTVIEVGVDVPNASLIIIENPERLGLAQLHQLRGRVGRGDTASYCVLMYHPPLSQNGKERLKVMRESNNGFVIAEKDLELRGPGEVLGTRQTGLMQFRLAELERDKAWLPEVKKLAPALMNDPVLVDALIERWLGNSVQYGAV